MLSNRGELLYKFNRIMRISNLPDTLFILGQRPLIKALLLFPFVLYTGGQRLEFVQKPFQIPAVHSR